MRLYFAGNSPGEDREQFFHEQTGFRHRLLTFADVDSWAVSAFNYWNSDKAPFPYFLDSGAFSAKSRGAVIDIKRYADYIKQVGAKADPYVCLDVIGNYKATAKNYDFMRGLGLDPIPTFHIGSPMHELRRLCSVANYIALGGMRPLGPLKAIPWLNECWRVIRDFWPIKVHAFGKMAQWCLEGYPWFSADSSGAIVGAGMGRVSRWHNAEMTALEWPRHGRIYFDGSVVDKVSKWSAGPSRRADGVGDGSAHLGRDLNNIREQLKLERHVTDVWRMRGVIWDE